MTSSRAFSRLATSAVAHGVSRGRLASIPKLGLRVLELETAVMEKHAQAPDDFIQMIFSRWFLLDEPVSMNPLQCLVMFARVLRHDSVNVQSYA